MNVTLDEIWALAKEHARSDGTDLPTIDPDYDNVRNSMVEGMEVKFHIDNDPAIYYTVGGVDDLVYEIWEMVSARRKPFVNGFALYIAFTGIFVHILQIALEAVSE